MIDSASVVALIRASLPDAEVRVTDLTGTMDHYDVRVRSQAFDGKTLLDQHRMVYSALEAARQDGRIHALQLTTEVPHG
ncbi:MAG: BolA/IbaG family iron-sulfur metabolism protein [Candidatus Eremiobacteraeota bacterium]|nr:BolA/IbaG family iron-sulfur metabolism protein [Candidatus Eremiobacteraeota bacterium]MBV8355055.1 BolA/IbaG family iron-sulfur metabolism protein [Candidatus Eremiobacteraeota bacterium]